EIILPDIDVDVAAPIVLDALENDISPGGKILDLVRTAAERRLERGFSDVALLAVAVRAFPPMFGKHAQLADNLRQLAVAGSVEGEGDLVVAGLLGFADMPVIGGLLRAIFLESIERKNYVGRRDRSAVMPLRLAAQPVRH